MRADLCHAFSVGNIFTRDEKTGLVTRQESSVWNHYGTCTMNNGGKDSFTAALQVFLCYCRTQSKATQHLMYLFILINAFSTIGFGPQVREIMANKRGLSSGYPVCPYRRRSPHLCASAFFRTERWRIEIITITDWLLCAIAFISYKTVMYNRRNEDTLICTGQVLSISVYNFEGESLDEQILYLGVE